MTQSRPKVVVIGGGTGSFTVLSGLRHLKYDLTALVNMVDDGGSTGQLRDEYGVLPPGDIRQCLVALSDAPESLRNLFNFRFPAGGALAGHSFGNLFLSALEIMNDNFLEAIKTASKVLNIRGQVLPVTTEKCQLIMENDGHRIVGQNNIDNVALSSGLRPKLSLEPPAKIAPEAVHAINEADLIVIAPGNLYSSIIPTLLVQGVSEGLQSAKAKVIYVCNLVNKPNHTQDFKVSDYISELELYGGQGTIDYVLYNVDTPSEELINKYANDKEYPVIIDEVRLQEASYKAVPARLLSYEAAPQNKNDVLLKRSFLRHDSLAVAREVDKIMKEVYRLQ